ncbi:MAG: hypothetical protein ABW168_19680 [Sedimenticola sp.]
MSDEHLDAISDTVSGNGLDHGDSSHHDNMNGSLQEQNSPDPEITFNRQASRLNSQLSDFTIEMKRALGSMRDQIENRLTQIDTRMRTHENECRPTSRSTITDQTNLSGRNHGENTDRPQIQSGDRSNSLDRPCNTQMTDNYNTNRHINASPIRNYQQYRGDNSLIKMKPQQFHGTEDLVDFLTQFDITTEINGWNYEAKSLYLAHSLTGGARSLLNELSPWERRDFGSLVEKLKSRYGSEGRAEVYRTQLKSRVRGKNETISELAQAIKKLTRQAYPSANQEIVEALALDVFIDALTDTDIRLRLREMGAKSLDEAEKTAVRMEAHRIADRQRYKSVCTATDHIASAKSIQTPTIETLNETVKTLSSKLDKLLQDPPTQKYHDQSRNSNVAPQRRNNIDNRPNYAPHRNSNRPRYIDQFASPNDRLTFNQSRGGNSNRVQNFPQQIQNLNGRRQGNETMSGWSGRISTEQNFPRSH